MAEPSAAPAIAELSIDELSCLTLRSAHGEALVALQGAQVLRYGPHGGQPVVWLSDQAAFRRGQPLRGGVPVCWPWFGDLDRNPQAVRDMVEPGAQAPAHGLVRALDWELAESSCADGVAAAMLRLPLPDGLPGWPHRAELSLRVEVGTALRLELTTRNLGTVPLVASQALHTYFAVSDCRRVAVGGLDGADYIDTLQAWGRFRQEGMLRIEGETDRIYTGVGSELWIDDAGWSRRIRVSATDSGSAVLWNPWIDKARRLSQFDDQAWQRMLCIETARVWDDLLVVPPGESRTMTVELACEPLTPEA